MRSLRYGVRRTGARPIGPLVLNRDSWQFNGLVMAVPILPHLDIPVSQTNDPLAEIVNNLNPFRAVGQTVITIELDAEMGIVARHDASASPFAIYTIPAVSAYFNTEGTICGWVKLVTATPIGGGSTGFPWVVGSASNGHYPFTDGVVYAPHFIAARQSFSPVAGVTRTEWHHLLITSKPGANGWACYQNGQLAFSTTGDATVAVTGNLEYGGGDNGGAAFNFDGWQCDFRLYNRWMSAEEALELASPQTRWDLFVSQSRRAFDLFGAAAAGITANQMAGIFDAQRSGGVIGQMWQ